MYSYVAYGMGIRCDIPLPDLIEQEAPADVVMRLGKPEPLGPINPNAKLCLQFNSDEAFFSYDKLGRCRISYGRQIIGEPALESDLKMLGGLAQTLGLSILLHQRGYVSLHASCVNLGSAAVAFLGDSTAGKSFIAAALHSMGHSLVADDVTVVDVDASVPLVYPGFPVVQLLPDAAEHFGLSGGVSEEFVPLEEKITWRFPYAFSQNPVRLRRLYLLEDGTSVRIESLSRHRAAFELVRFSYWIRLMHDARPSSYFLQCARLCKRVPVQRLIRPRSASAMPEVVHVLQEDLLKDASPARRFRTL